MAGRMNDAQSASLKFKLAFVIQRTVLMFRKRVRVLAHALIHAAHGFDFSFRYTRAYQQLSVLFIFKPPDAMTSFPIVNQDFRVFCFLTKRAGQPAMVFVRMREHDPPNVRDENPCLAQAFA